MADGEINRNGATIRIDDNGGVQVEPADGEGVEFTGPDTGGDATRDSVKTDDVQSNSVNASEQIEFSGYRFYGSGTLQATTYNSEDILKIEHTENGDLVVYLRGYWFGEGAPGHRYLMLTSRSSNHHFEEISNYRENNYRNHIDDPVFDEDNEVWTVPSTGTQGSIEGRFEFVIEANSGVEVTDLL